MENILDNLRDEVLFRGPEDDLFDANGDPTIAPAPVGPGGTNPVYLATDTGKAYVGDGSSWNREQNLDVGPAAYADEDARDALAAALEATGAASVTVDDESDTITIGASQDLDLTPQDVTTVSSPSVGMVRYHDGSDGGDGTLPAGLAEYRAGVAAPPATIDGFEGDLSPYSGATGKASIVSSPTFSGSGAVALSGSSPGAIYASSASGLPRDFPKGTTASVVFRRNANDSINQFFFRTQDEANTLALVLDFEFGYLRIDERQNGSGTNISQDGPDSDGVSWSPSVDTWYRATITQDDGTLGGADNDVTATVEVVGGSEIATLDANSSYNASQSAIGFFDNGDGASGSVGVFDDLLLPNEPGAPGPSRWYVDGALAEWSGTETLSGGSWTWSSGVTSDTARFAIDGLSVQTTDGSGNVPVPGVTRDSSTDEHQVVFEETSGAAPEINYTIRQTRP
jgi:hypothetical protein